MEGALSMARIGLRKSSSSRRGAAAVECALMLPLYVLLVLGAIDVGRAVAVKHTLAEAARAGCRIYTIKEELTQQDARDMIDKAMTDAGFDNYTVEFDPSSSDDIVHLEPVTVSVSLAFDDVSLLPSQFLAGRTLTGACIMPGDTGEIIPGGSSPNLPGDDDDDDDDDDDGDDDDDDPGHGHGGGRPWWWPWWWW